MTSSFTTDRSELNAATPSPALELLEDEAPARRQPGVLVSCLLEGLDEPLELRITNRERIAYEKTAAKHPEWPDRAISFTTTFCTFVAAKRAGHPLATTFEDWQNILLDWDEVEAPADPTR